MLKPRDSEPVSHTSWGHRSCWSDLSLLKIKWVITTYMFEGLTLRISPCDRHAGSQSRTTGQWSWRLRHGTDSSQRLGWRQRYCCFHLRKTPMRSILAYADGASRWRWRHRWCGCEEDRALLHRRIQQCQSDCLWTLSEKMQILRKLLLFFTYFTYKTNTFTKEQIQEDQ